MKIQITTTLTVSKANEAMVDIVAKKSGWTDGERDDFVKSLLSEQAIADVRSLIVPAIYAYFGDAQINNSKALDAELATALTSVVDISYADDVVIPPKKPVTPPKK